MKLSAEILERKIRAFNPRPVVFTELNGQMVRVWEASIIPLTRPAGDLSRQGRERCRDIRACRSRRRRRQRRARHG